MTQRQPTPLVQQTGMDDRLPLYKRIVWVYALLLAAVGVALISAVEYWPGADWLQRHGTNFGADFVGLGLTLLLIDRIVAWRREADVHPLRQSAVRRIGKAVRDLEIQMAWVFKAATPPMPEPSTIDELIDAFVVALTRLDFDAEVGPETIRWRTFLPQRLRQIGASLDRAVTRHEELLPPALAAAIDAIVDDPSLRLLMSQDALATALDLVDQGELLPQAPTLARLLKDLYRHYSAFRGRDYALVAWEVSRPWATATHAAPGAPGTPDHASRPR